MRNFYRNKHTITENKDKPESNHKQSSEKVEQQIAVSQEYKQKETTSKGEGSH